MKGRRRRIWTNKCLTRIKQPPHPSCVCDAIHLLPLGEKGSNTKNLYFTSSTKGSSVARFSNAM
jgi:hypothetical protein